MKGNTRKMKDGREKGSRAIVTASVTIIIALLVSAVLVISFTAPDDDADAAFGNNSGTGIESGGLGLRYTISGGNASVTGHVQANLPDAVNVVIPATVPVTGEPVTSIGDNAFRDCATIESITMPDSVTTIKTYAFYQCTNLSSVTLSSTLETIGERAFLRCSFDTIDIPASLKSIGMRSFYGCASLGSIVLPEGFETIGPEAFRLCEGLTTVGLPSTVTDIGHRAFLGCKNLGSIVIPEGITVIKEYTFNGCTKLASVTLPSTLETIEGYAFRNCESLTTINLTPALTSIGTHAFNYCINLVSVGDTSMVETFGTYAFWDCRSLVSIDLSSAVTINEQAFNYCCSLESITVPSSTSFIGHAAFVNCYGLTSFEVDAGNAYYCSVDNVLFTKDMSVLMFCMPKKDGPTYMIPATVTSVAGGGIAFIGAINLESITVEAGNLDYCAEDGVLFTMDMSELVLYPAGKKGASYTVPDSVSVIGGSSFRWNKNLEKIVLSDSVTNLPRRVFQECSSLTDVNTGNIKTVYDNVFADCTSLESVDLSNVTSIATDAFAYLDGMKILTLPEGFALTPGMGISEEVMGSLVVVFVSGGYKSVSATLDGTMVTLDIKMPDGYAVKTIKVGTTVGDEDICAPQVSWTFDIGSVLEIHVAIERVAGFVITIPPEAGGHFEYKPLGENVWRNVVNGKVNVPAGWTAEGWIVEIRGVPDNGYGFQWDDERHRSASDENGVLKLSPTGDVTITGTFSLIKEDEEDDVGSYWDILVFLVACSVLMLMIIIGIARKKRS
jgi:hypothetical protein